MLIHLPRYFDLMEIKLNFRRLRIKLAYPSLLTYQEKRKNPEGWKTGLPNYLIILNNAEIILVLLVGSFWWDRDWNFPHLSHSLTAQFLLTCPPIKVEIVFCLSNSMSISESKFPDCSWKISLKCWIPLYMNC